MKLQYLGDSRDAFKWDLLHWICSHSDPPFSKLLFVPLLTRDDPMPIDGQTPHTRFRARPAIQAFVGSLRGHPEGIRAICALGRIDPSKVFDVQIHAPATAVPDGVSRSEYWLDLQPHVHANTLLFLDPDNGFEIKSERGGKWVLDSEVAWLLCDLPVSSAVVVYQHWPHRPWSTVFKGLLPRLQYAPYVSAAHDHSLAVILLARDPETGWRIDTAVKAYAKAHTKVQYTMLKSPPKRGDSGASPR